MVIRFLAWVGVVACGGGQALAAHTPAPLLAPRHDVTVAYSFTPAGRAPMDITVAVAAGGQKLHVRGADLPVVMVIDRAAGVAQLMLPIAAAYATVSIAGQDPERAFLRDARFTRGAGRRVAGLACTDWTAVRAAEHAQACITSDGVILDGSVTTKSHGTSRVKALRVSQAPLAREMFSVPSNYTSTGAFPVPMFDPGQ